MDKKLLIHYSIYKIKDGKNLKSFLEDFEKFTNKVFFYITTPFRSEYDLLVWSIILPENVKNFFISFTKHKFKF
ncbi:MAG: hypothetical protein ABIL76_04560, partial [candidate division WOR-3 bacterium]